MFYLTFCIVCIIVTNTKYCMIFMEGENMVISINDASEIPIYQQIRNQIVLGISDGRLAPGEQLPTVRALAEEIGINSMTVSKCSCSKFLSQILKIVVKNFSEIVPGKQTQKEGFRPLIFLTHSMRITLLIIIEFDPCIYAVKFNFIPFQVPLYQAADVIQNRT